jgi:hypothetical protein
MRAEARAGSEPRPRDAFQREADKLHRQAEDLEHAALNLETQAALRQLAAQLRVCRPAVAARANGTGAP